MKNRIPTSAATTVAVCVCRAGLATSAIAQTTLTGRISNAALRHRAGHREPGESIQNNDA
jgi:hypothetical protein